MHRFFSSELDEIYGVAGKMFPFGNEEGIIHENSVQKEIIERNLPKFLKESSKISLVLRTLTQYFPISQSDHFSDFNINYTFFFVVSILRTFKSITNSKDIDYFSEYFNYVNEWLETFFAVDKDSETNFFLEISKKFAFFKFDLLKDEQLDFLIENLLTSSDISLFLLEKELLVLKVFLKELFLDLITYNFFESSIGISKNLRFFSLHLEDFKFKHSYLYKGFICELKTIIKNVEEFSEKSKRNTYKFAKLRVLLCVQEFFEPKIEEIELKKGFDEAFFLAQTNELTISSEYQLNCILFQRKVPQTILSKLTSYGIFSIDALGQKNFNNLSYFLNMTPLHSLASLQKYNFSLNIKEIIDMELMETDDNHYFLMIPSDRNISDNTFYNLLFFLPRENLLKNRLFETIPLILETIYAALLEEEFVLEKGSFEMVFLVYLIMKTYDLIKESENKRQIIGYLKGFYCIFKGFKEILENYSLGEKIEEFFVLEKFFTNSLNYLNDYRLFIEDCEELRRSDLETIYKKSILIYEEVKCYKWLNLEDVFEGMKKMENLQDMINLLFEDLNRKKSRKIIQSMKINKKSKKFDSFKLLITVIKEFPYLNF